MSRLTVGTSHEGGNPPFLGRLSPLSQLVVALLVGTALALGIATVLAAVTAVSLGVTLAGYLAGAVFSVLLLRSGYPHGALGLGNLVTVTRMALAAALLAPLLGVAVPWAVVSVATIALVLDGADGWLARREGRVSSFGARLDVEVDSALALILALNVWAAGVTGPLILLLALPRYAFVGAGLVVPWLRQPLPESLARKVVCVVQLAVLVALNSQILPGWFIVTVVAVVAGALVWSFGRDIWWLWRSRP